MSAPPISLNKLALLDTLIETGSVTAAARRLNRSQPSVTAALNDLRVHFGDPLLVRKGSGLQPTPFARQLAPELAAFRLQAELIADRRKAFAPETSTRQFVVRATDYLQSLFAPAMVRLVTPFPGLSLRFLMTEGSHFEALGQGKADFAFRLAGPVEAGIVYRELKVDPFVVVWDRKTPSPVGDLDAFCARPHILATPEGGEFGQLDERLHEAGRSRRIAARTQNIFSAVRLVANSPMIAVAPRSVALEIARAHDLEMAAPPLDLPPSRISLAWSRAHDADPASAWLREGLFASLPSLLPLAGEGVPLKPSPPSSSR